MLQTSSLDGSTSSASLHFSLLLFASLCFSSLLFERTLASKPTSRKTPKESDALVLDINTVLSLSATYYLLLTSFVSIALVFCYCGANKTLIRDHSFNILDFSSEAVLNTENLSQNPSSLFLKARAVRLQNY